MWEAARVTGLLFFSEYVMSVNYEEQNPDPWSVKSDSEKLVWIKLKLKKGNSGRW